jgi:hypothetical protein
MGKFKMVLFSKRELANLKNLMIEINSQESKKLQ